VAGEQKAEVALGGRDRVVGMDFMLLSWPLLCSPWAIKLLRLRYCVTRAFKLSRKVSHTLKSNSEVGVGPDGDFTYFTITLCGAEVRIKRK
jgi:hypothetical protein